MNKKSVCRFCFFRKRYKSASSPFRFILQARWRPGTRRFLFRPTTFSKENFSNFRSQGTVVCPLRHRIRPYIRLIVTFRLHLHRRIVSRFLLIYKNKKTLKVATNSPLPTSRKHSKMTHATRARTFSMSPPTRIAFTVSQRNAHRRRVTGTRQQRRWPQIPMPLH